MATYDIGYIGSSNVPGGPLKATPSTNPVNGFVGGYALAPVALRTSFIAPFALFEFLNFNGVSAYTGSGGGGPSIPTSGQIFPSGR